MLARMRQVVWLEQLAEVSEMSAPTFQKGGKKKTKIGRRKKKKEQERGITFRPSQAVSFSAFPNSSGRKEVKPPAASQATAASVSPTLFTRALRTSATTLDPFSWDLRLDSLAKKERPTPSADTTESKTLPKNSAAVGMSMIRSSRNSV